METSKMTKAEAGRLGALKTAENIRKRYEKRHDNKFCNHSCSAKYNNAKTKLNNTEKLDKKEIIKKAKTKKNCKECGKECKKTYCSNKCQNDYQHKKTIEKWKSGEIISLKTIRRYLFEKYKNKCAECGWDKVNQYTGNIPLEVEHIDGNSENNLEENLTLLCPCCHSLTKTYKGANKGNGRHYRRERYANGQSY